MRHRTAAGHGRRTSARPGPVRAQHRLPHPVPEHHHRAGVVPGLLPRQVRALARPGLARHLPPVGQGVRALLRHGRGLGRHHELPVRHQLARLHEPRRQYRRAAARLRGADGVFSRSDVPRRDALWHEPRAGVAAHRLHRARGCRNDAVGVLVEGTGQCIRQHVCPPFTACGGGRGAVVRIRDAGGRRRTNGRGGKAGLRGPPYGPSCRRT